MNLTDRNLDQLTSLLLAQDERLLDIPNGAHIFYGAYNDTTFTQANFRLASRIQLAIALGYVDDASLVMVFEDKPNHWVVVDLWQSERKKFIETVVTRFQEDNQRDMWLQLDKTLVA